MYGQNRAVEPIRSWFTESRRIASWLEILGAIAQAQADVGEVPHAAADDTALDRGAARSGPRARPPGARANLRIPPGASRRRPQGRPRAGHGIVEAHQGRVSVVNTVRGCCFEVRLPANETVPGTGQAGLLSHGR
jgi:hypothetical protein